MKVWRSALTVSNEDSSRKACTKNSRAGRPSPARSGVTSDSSRSSQVLLYRPSVKGVSRPGTIGIVAVACERPDRNIHRRGQYLRGVYSPDAGYFHFLQPRRPGHRAGRFLQAGGQRGLRVSLSGRPAPGSRLHRFEIIELLGVGGMGEVYRARDPRLGREVALKLLSPQFLRNTQRLARFERETQVLASLNHPNIAALYEILVLEGQPRAGAGAGGGRDAVGADRTRPIACA